MTVNKKVLSIAIVGALAASGSAFAQVDLSDPDAEPAYYAQEIVASTTTPRVLTNTEALNWDIGYNFSENEVRYARVECSSNLRFSATASVASSDAAAASIGSVNGLGTNVLTFSLTSLNTPAGNNIDEEDVLTVTGSHSITGTDAPVNCSVGLYDQPSQAQTGGTVGLIQNTFFNGPYIAFAPSYRFVTDPMEGVANVESDPSFSNFYVNATTTSDRAALSGWVYGVAPAPGGGNVLNIAGAPIALSDVLGAATHIDVTGDFALARNAGTTNLYTGDALTRVFLSSDDCVSSDMDADALTATTARFDVGNTALAADTVFCVAQRTGNGAIAVADYTATLDVTAASANYAPTDIGPRDAGSIVRNGTELQAPLAQVPAGYISRMVLTNKGSMARTYSVEVMTEAGNTRSGGDTSLLTGSIPANSLVVVDLNPLMGSFTGAPRGTLNATVAGPNNQIQGLYQIVNPANGSISNHVMVRPGTN